MEVLAAVEVAGRSALWIRGGCRQDYKRQVMSGKHHRPAPIREGYVNVLVDKMCFSALSIFSLSFPRGGAGLFWVGGEKEDCCRGRCVYAVNV